MAGFDTLTDIRLPLGYQKNKVLQSLITQEITQKLDLVLHLLTNSKKELIICGPEGIGKSTLLTLLQTNNTESWLYCLVQGNKNLSLEKIQDRLSRTISPSKINTRAQDLIIGFYQLEKTNKKIILIIDDADYLEPDLINILIDYATNNPLLRIIFVLTSEGLALKNDSDETIQDCHLIELQPFTKAQCGRFLEFLASSHQARVGLNEINEDLIEAIYLKTQGIPGNIISNLPAIERFKYRNNSLRILVVGVILLIFLALATQWLSASKQDRTTLLKSLSVNPTARSIALLGAWDTPSTTTLECLRILKAFHW